MTSSPKRPGRPALTVGQLSTPINLRVSGQMYDAVFNVAEQKRTTIPELIRRAVGRFLADERSGRVDIGD